MAMARLSRRHEETMHEALKAVGESEALHAGLIKDLTLDDSNILICAPVPDDSKDILDAVISDVLIKVNIITEINHVVLNHFFQVLAWKVGLKFLFGRYSEIYVPGDIRWVLPLQCHFHYSSFIQPSLQKNF